MTVGRNGPEKNKCDICDADWVLGLGFRLGLRLGFRLGFRSILGGISI